MLEEEEEEDFFFGRPGVATAGLLAGAAVKSRGRSLSESEPAPAAVPPPFLYATKALLDLDSSSLELLSAEEVAAAVADGGSASLEEEVKGLASSPSLLSASSSEYLLLLLALLLLLLTHLDDGDFTEEFETFLLLWSRLGLTTERGDCFSWSAVALV